MSRLTLNAKLWAALAVMLVLLLALGAWSAFHTKSVMMAERRDGLQSLVATGDNSVAQVENGSTLVTKAGETMHEVVSAVRH